MNIHSMQVRLATVDDAEPIRRIYERYVLESPATFEITPPTVNEMERRISTVMEKYPFLICQKDGEIIGYAYASRFREREAYRFAVASSVYIRADCHAKGIGTELYAALFAILKRQNYLTCVVGITLPNEGSVALHRKFGFVEAGVLHSVGYKAGKWHDVLSMQKQLTDECPAVPKPVVPVTALDLSELLRE